jgi:hypothetical protein
MMRHPYLLHKTGALAAASAVPPRNNERASAGVLNGGTLLPDELFQSLLREAQPWFAFPTERARGLTASQRDETTSRSFVTTDRAIQEFALRWIDPLFGERAARHLQDMGLPERSQVKRWTDAR